MRRSIGVAVLELVAGTLLVAACGPRAGRPVTKTPDAGISIALYRAGDTSYGVVDDRRWVEISGTSIFLPNIDPGASLASLVIETSHPGLRIGPCTRERLPDARDLTTNEANEIHTRERALLRWQRDQELIERNMRKGASPQPIRPTVTVQDRFAPIVQCDVDGPPGRHLVRIVYVSSTLSYRVQHDLTLREPTKATLESRFAVTTPNWRERADVVMFDGLPGGAEPPREVARGAATLDGGTSVLVSPSRDLPAQLRRIFEGQAFEKDDDLGDKDPSSVWVTLEVPGLALAPGPMRIHLELDGEDRWIDVPRLQQPDRDAERTPSTKGEDAPLRLRLWVDDGIRGMRHRQVIENDGLRMVETVRISLTNVGDTMREVWVEEHARPAKRTQIDRPWPRKPSTRGNTIRNKLEVRPGKVEQAGYTLVYEL